MKVLHSSDLHGRWDSLFKIKDFDIWVDTGDFFYNYTNPRFNKVNLQEEKRGQKESILSYKQEFIEWIENRPVLSIPGNHDFISLASSLRDFEIMAYDLSQEYAVSLLGEQWAGFREVPFMGGYWNGETHEFKEVLRETFSFLPTILVTHAPPLGILDQGGMLMQNLGIPHLSFILEHRKHKVKHHFFGHIHEQGGKSIQKIGVQFHNSATKARIIEI